MFLPLPAFRWMKLISEPAHKLLARRYGSDSDTAERVVYYTMSGKDPVASEQTSRDREEPPRRSHGHAPRSGGPARLWSLMTRIIWRGQVQTLPVWYDVKPSELSRHSAVFVPLHQVADVFLREIDAVFFHELVFHPHELFQSYVGAEYASHTLTLVPDRG